MLLEAVYHIPLSLWAVPALLRDDILVPLHLLIWACETALTTLTCVVEAMSWDGLTGQEKAALAQLYVPYLLLGMYPASRWFRGGRLTRKLEQQLGWALICLYVFGAKS